MPNKSTIACAFSGRDYIISSLKFRDNFFDIFMNEFDDIGVVLLKPDKDVMNALGLIFILFFVVA